MYGAPRLNPAVSSLGDYASKRASAEAKAAGNVADLSLGEPFFGPPEYCRNEVISDLSWEAVVPAIKSYENGGGLFQLREEISSYYRRRYGIEVNPETEILVTHGGVEAIALALLTLTAPKAQVALTDPTYMLYSRAATALGRTPVAIGRPIAEDEYASAREAGLLSLEQAEAIIINSPENPTGYVLSSTDWKAIVDAAERSSAWIIHDEVYDTMAFGRNHMPALGIPRLRDRAVVVNSFSKKFGVPGLRIGWLCGPSDVIKAATQVHDYLYLGVNIVAEKIALRMVAHPEADNFLSASAGIINERRIRMISELGEVEGFVWDRPPHGGMFAFPNISGLFASICEAAPVGIVKGDYVARFLRERMNVAVVPGSVYGNSCADHIRFVLCSDATTFDTALERLALGRSIPPFYNVAGQSFGA